ncbi:cytochrome P450 family protein, partial [Candidatus Thiomargarita nelsonii]
LAGERYSFEVKEQQLADAETETSIKPLQLSATDVVLFTGGARGITAQCALAVAQRYQCHIVLLGRTPQPEADESPEIAAAQDLPALRKMIIEQHPQMRPAQIETECAKILANREIIHTLDEIKAAGSRVDYYSVDVRDKDALGNLMTQIAKQHGTLKGIIHGAGIIEDKLIRHKTLESFERVLTTKVVGALNLVEIMPPTVEFVVFFSSIAGVFGNRGQVDYATANDALDKLSKLLNNKIKGRVISINWGPWAAGMVSAE